MVGIELTSVVSQDWPAAALTRDSAAMPAGSREESCGKARPRMASCSSAVGA